MIEKGEEWIVFYNHYLFNLDKEKIAQILETSINFSLEIVEETFYDINEGWRKEFESFIGITIATRDIENEFEKTQKFVDKIHYWLTSIIIHELNTPSKRRWIINYMDFLNRDKTLIVAIDGRIISLPLFHALSETIIRILDVGISKKEYYKYHVQKAMQLKPHSKIAYYRRQILMVDNVNTHRGFFLKALAKYGANPTSTARHLGDKENVSIKRIKKVLTSLPPIGWL